MRLAADTDDAVHHLGHADRHLRLEEVGALGAHLEQQHAMGAAFRQPARGDRARGSRADDDVAVGRVALRSCSFDSPRAEGSKLGGRLQDGRRPEFANGNMQIPR